jgi:hypothetical protein
MQDILLFNGNKQITYTHRNSQKEKEAAECLLKSIFTKYEDLVFSVAIDNCLMKEKPELEDKIDVVSTEAMIHEANISTNSAKIIICHLQQHFG